MYKNNMKLAEEYYTLMGQKNAEGIKKCLHPDVELYSPFATVIGKEAVVTAATNFINTINSLTIRAKFGSEDHAMIVCDSDVIGITKTFPTASLLSFRDNLIIKIELFYDTKPLVEKKEEIFS